MLTSRATLTWPSALALSRALLAGFVASVAMILAFGIAFVAALAIGRLPIPILGDWFRGLTNNPLIDLARPNVYAATSIFFAGGLIWAVLYAVVAEPRLPGRAWERGVLFASIPWLFSLLVFLPLVGGGVLGTALGAGPLPVLGNLILHGVYGAVLGGVFAPATDALPDQPGRLPDGDDAWAGPSSELGAARGLLIGLAVGVVLGLLGSLLLNGSQTAGLNPLWATLATSVSGGAFGGLVGSLAGAGETQTGR